MQRSGQTSTKTALNTSTNFTSRSVCLFPSSSELDWLFTLTTVNKYIQPLFTIYSCSLRGWEYGDSSEWDTASMQRHSFSSLLSLFVSWPTCSSATNCQTGFLTLTRNGLTTLMSSSWFLPSAQITLHGCSLSASSHHFTWSLTGSSTKACIMTTMTPTQVSPFLLFKKEICSTTPTFVLSWF